MTVFSDIIKQHYAWCRSAAERTKRLPSEYSLRLAVTLFSKHEDYGIPDVFIAEDTPKDLADAITTARCLSPRIRKLEAWITNKIVLQPWLSPKTVEVRLRIATNMLNSLKIDKRLAMEMHYGFVTNIKGLFLDLLNEELPF